MIKPLHLVSQQTSKIKDGHRIQLGLVFSKSVGLKDFFYNESYGLLSNHPGSVHLQESHKDIIDKAISDYKIKYPTAVAKMELPEENSHLARLEWLKYWFDWSLKNCKTPTFKNT